MGMVFLGPNSIGSVYGPSGKHARKGAVVAATSAVALGASRMHAGPLALIPSRGVQ